MMLCGVGSIVWTVMFFSIVSVNADSVIYQFEPISTGPLSPSAPELQATFQDEKPGVVQLNVTSDLAGGEFVSDLYFNFDPKDNVNRLHFTRVGDRGRPLSRISTGVDKFKADGGYYDIRFAFGTTGQNEFSGDESVTYLIKEPGLDASDFAFLDSTGSCGGTNGLYYAVAQIQTGCNEYEWLAASTTTPQPVPEPASLALLASAGGLGWCVCSRANGMSRVRRFLKRCFIS